MQPPVEDMITRDPGLMPGFQRLRIVLATGPLSALPSKPRFKGAFDAGVFGPAAAFAIGASISALFKPAAQVYVETLK